ncbi:MAG TPA: helix-turn-helix transcriptional regulator, partial [Bryobacteraceae bacterium]|nr:helix-turn-helix transcriptional regulator [Bryobacteraceae bacterium]
FGSIQEGGGVNELLDRLREEFRDEDSRYAYADSVANAFIAAQIKALREERKLTQEKLAELTGTKQSGISRFQKAEYSGWKVETLRKLAKAFGVRLRISFEEFGTLPTDVGGFSKERLAPRKFEDDPIFNPKNELKPEKAAVAAAPNPALTGLSNVRPEALDAIRGALSKAAEAARRYAQHGSTGLAPQEQVPEIALNDSPKLGGAPDNVVPIDIKREGLKRLLREREIRKHA